MKILLTMIVSSILCIFCVKLANMIQQKEKGAYFKKDIFLKRCEHCGNVLLDTPSIKKNESTKFLKVIFTAP